MFKNAVSMMGANEQILAPAAEKLDQFVALGGGGQYANYQEQTQMAPDTSAVPTAGEIGGNVAGQRAQSTANPGQHREASTAQPVIQLAELPLKALTRTMVVYTLQMKVAQVKVVFILRQTEIL